MATDSPTTNRQTLRRTDSNSLLRLYDQAKGRHAAGRTQQQRESADKVLQRIVDELRRRQVPH
jgi:hypothetical protein